MAKEFCIGAFLLLLGAPSSYAQQTTVLGMDHTGRATPLSSAVCVVPGQQIRVVADVLDDHGVRLWRPANSFLWRVTTGYGRWFQWDAHFSAGYGPFARGPEMDSVYLTILQDNGVARLETTSAGTYGSMIYLVDPRAAPYRCDWAPADVYVAAQPQDPIGTPDSPNPTPSPSATSAPYPPEYAIACQGRCAVGAKCYDGCPIEAICDGVGGNPNYWLVRTCPARH